MRIGQEIEVKEDFKINTIVSDKVITVKKGDKGFLDSKGLMNITTGNGRGKIVKINDVKVKGYDHENISKLIYKRLCSSFEIGDFLYDNDIEANKMIEEIEDILSDIL